MSGNVSLNSLKFHDLAKHNNVRECGRRTVPNPLKFCSCSFSARNIFFTQHLSTMFRHHKPLKQRTLPSFIIYQCQPVK